MEKYVTKHYRRGFYSIGFMILFTLFTAIQAVAQNGKIVGMVSDSLSETGLVGANLYLTGTAMGAATDINSEFSIMNIPPGSYVLEISYIGYHKKRIDVTIEPGEALVEKIVLRPLILESDVVVITAQREGQLAAINQQLQSDQLVSVVSSERMREVPDANAAESVARLPGVSITRKGGEGSAVIIRGMAPQYNSIQVNGVILPATGDINRSTGGLSLGVSTSGSRSTSISSIASENLSGIEVFKSITADMDANNIGGSVNMVLAKAKAKPRYAVRLYGLYHEMEGDFNQFRGFAQMSDRFFDGKLGVQVSINGEKRNRGRDKLTASYDQKEKFVIDPTHPDGYYYQKYYEIKAAAIEDRRETRERYGGSLILDYAIGSNEFQLTSITSYNKAEAALFEHGFHSYYGNGYVRPTILDNNGSLIANILAGKHNIFGLEAKWGASHARSTANLPFSHHVNFNENNVNFPSLEDDPEHFLSILPNDSFATAHTVSWSKIETEENRYALTMDFKYPFNLSTQVSGYLKFGGKWQNIVKDKSSRSKGGLSQEFAGQLNYTDWIERGYDPGEVLGGRTKLGYVLDPQKNRALYEWAKANSPSYQKVNPYEKTNDYNVDENIYAGYIMFNLKYQDLIKFIPGVRIESENNDYTGTYFWRIGQQPYYAGSVFYPRTANRKNKYWFPMIHFQIKPMDWLVLRLAYTETISRPSFTRLIPNERRYEYGVNPDISIGMPQLKPVISSNYDISTNLYESKYGFLSIGLFYKEIKNFAYSLKPFIETEEEAASYGLPPNGNSPNLNQYTDRYVSLSANLPEPSQVRGFEIDFQPNLALLPGFLSGIVVHANYTRIWSSSQLPKRLWIIDSSHPKGGYFEVSWRKERLPSQADDLINFSLGYDIKGFSARISYFHQGGVLGGVGPIALKDVYVDPFSRWDFTVKQDIGKHVTLYLNGENIGNTPDQSVQAKTRKYRSISYFGAIYDFGIQYLF